MPCFVWPERFEEDVDHDAGCISCPSAFDDGDDEPGDSLICSVSTSDEAEEIEELYRERRQLIAERLSAQRQRANLERKMESLTTRVLRAQDKRQQLQTALRMPVMSQRHYIRSEFYGGKVEAVEHKFTESEPVKCRQASPCEHDVVSLPLEEASSMSGELTCELAAENLRSETPDRAKGRRCQSVNLGKLPFNRLSACKADSPASGRSIASLSTRTSMLSYRSAMPSNRSNNSFSGLSPTCEYEEDGESVTCPRALAEDVSDSSAGEAPDMRISTRAAFPRRKSESVPRGRTQGTPVRARPRVASASRVSSSSPMRGARVESLLSVLCSTAPKSAVSRSRRVHSKISDAWKKEPASEPEQSSSRPKIQKHRVGLPIRHENKRPSAERRPRRTASAPGVSPQRQMDQKDWARRGISGNSPPPREMSFKDSNRAGVRVLCRVRPLFDEKAQLPRSVRMVDTTTIEVSDMVGGASRTFRVDSAVDETGSTGDVFAIVRSVAQSAMSGACAAVVAYGPTGSGKTHMMHGNAREPGLVIRTAAELMNHGEVELSMIEMHNDNLLDLMCSPGHGPGHTPASLEIRNCGNGVQVAGCQKVRCTTVMALLTGIRTGLNRRQVAETKVNSKSSRSHVIVTLHVGSGNVMLIDLAGLERVKRSGAEGSVLREAQSINKSLQSLSEVVDALRRGAAHVPCRNSRLARLMSGALGGGIETKVIVCVSPNPETRDESVAALCFAERVRRIPAAKKIVRDEQVSASEAP